MRALLPGPALRRSSELFRKRPWATLALGLALLSSLAAVCCGLGILAAPWFLCELFALQIALGTGVTPRRSSSWLGAAWVQMAAVAVLGAIACISLLALGPDVVLGGIARGVSSAADQVLGSLGILLLTGSLAIALSVHFEHAPAILIDRGGGLHAALLESARLVAETGPFRTWITSVAAHGLQMAPGLAAVVFAAGHASLASTLVWGIALLPVVAVCLALGQGMVVSSYLSLRDQVTDPASVPPEAAPSKSGAFVWSLLLSAVLAGPLLVSVALTQPAEPPRGSLPADAEILLDLAPQGAPRSVFVPDSALTLELDTSSLAVVASDGGGAGRLPLPRGSLRRVRVARPALVPAGLTLPASGSRVTLIESTLADGRSFATYVDEAGVRLDDSLSLRLAGRLPAWGPLALALCLVWTAFWIAYALPPQARLRRELAEQYARGLAPGQREGLKTRLRRSALLAALWLVPAAAGALALGLHALLG